MRTPRLSTPCATVVASMLLAGCAGKAEREAFAVEPGLIAQSINTLVLTPVSLPTELDPYADHMEEFDSLIADLLAQTDFVLIPAREYSTLWEDVMEQAGGLFDPVTGERDEEKFAAARDTLFSLLTELYHPDALLYPEIWIVGAPFSEGTARWDGTSQGLVGFGTRLIDALGAAFSGSESNLPEGTVDALSLAVFIETMEGEELYANSSGIQIMQKVGRDPLDVRPVPGEEILSNHDRNRRAILAVFEPLLTVLQTRSDME
jgi:hypothetical protein